MDVIEWTGVAAAACRDHHAMHNPSELGMLLHMLDTHQGRIILEIGACYGGSAWAWCQVPSVKKVITVDSGIRPEGREALAALPAAVLVEGDSADPATRQAVLDELGGDQADAVFIDGGHDYATARNDWFWYGQMCKPGGLVIFHDTQPGPDGIEVPRLWAQIREWRTLELVEKPGDKGCGIVWMPRGLPDAGLAAGQGRGRYHRVQHGQVDGQLHARGAERVDADPRIRAVQADPQGQRADRHFRYLHRYRALGYQHLRGAELLGARRGEPDRAHRADDLPLLFEPGHGRKPAGRDGLAAARPGARAGVRVMPWSAQAAIVLYAGNTIINPNGVFVYNSSGPGAGNLIASMAPAAGTDPYGNSFVEGSVGYITSGGSTFALELGNQGAAGSGFFVHDITSPPNADPGYSANLASPTAGCVAEITSGKGQIGDAAATLLIGDSRSSLVANGLIQLVCGATLLNSSAVSSIPEARPTLATLPTDNNSGSTWVSGERAFMNTNWVGNINANFTAIVNSLVAAGIWS